MNDNRQCCHVGYTAQHFIMGLFQDSDFAGDLEGSKSTSGGVLCIFGSRTCVPVSWMCKKQTSVSHSSSESEIIALDAEPRMDGLLALDLWDIVIEVLRTIKGENQPILSCSRKLEAGQPNLTSSSTLAAVQPNGIVCNSKTMTENVKASRRLTNWVRWNTCSPTHILPKVNLSCTFLLITRL